MWDTNSEICEILIVRRYVWLTLLSTIKVLICLICLNYWITLRSTALQNHTALVQCRDWSRLSSPQAHIGFIGNLALIAICGVHFERQKYFRINSEVHFDQLNCIFLLILESTLEDLECNLEDLECTLEDLVCTRYSPARVQQVPAIPKWSKTIR